MLATVVYSVIEYLLWSIAPRQLLLHHLEKGAARAWGNVLSIVCLKFMPTFPTIRAASPSFIFKDIRCLPVLKALISRLPVVFGM